MKKRKRFFICVLTGILACSGCLTASADSAIDAGKLKSGLLLNERNNYQYNIFDYNTNNDQSVNVLDLCRSKAYVLEKNKKTTQSINISCLRPWVTSDGSIITIPVNIKGNTEGVSSLSFFIEYNNWYFKLDSAYSSYGQVSYSSVNDYVQFTAYDGKNVTEECNIVYLVFSTVPDVPYSTYEFNLSDIQGTVLGSDGNQRELSDEEYNSDSARLQYTFSRGNSRPDVTTTPPNTTVVTTSSATETTVSQTEPQSGDKLSFSMDNAELSSDGKRLRIPVYMQKNTTGLFSFNAIVKYDTDKFSLTGVTQGDFSGYGYVGGNKDNAVFNTFNNQNIYENSGVIAYLEFDINNGTGSGVYEFELTDIKAYYSENWNQQEVPQDKRNDRSEVYRYSFESGSVTTTVTPQTTVTTTVTTTTPVTTTTTAITTTTPWEPPVTTTTTTPWEPPVTTTTTTAEPPVTTTEQTQGDYTLSDEQQWFIDEVNKFRTSNGKSEITVIKKAFKAADERAEMLSQSFTVDLPDGRNYKWALYDNDIMPYCISQYINNTASTKEQAFSNYLSSSKSFLLDDSMYDRFAVGHYTDGSGRHYWAMFTFG
ncbi:MAG: cohesin domain-containing protein [Oscillospiraceae bacterium]